MSRPSFLRILERDVVVCIALTLAVPWRASAQAPPDAGELSEPPASAADAGTLAEAPEQPDAPDTVADTIEVRGVRVAPEVTAHSLATDEIRIAPGTGGDVLRSIETMPGVARPAANDGVLIIRGSAPDDSAVFVDGTDVPFAYHLGGATSIIPADVIDHLDFLPGNFGPEYGRVMGGVVALGLRAPRADRLGGLVQFDVIDGRLLLETPLGDDTRVLLAGRRSWVDAWLGSALSDASTSVRTAPVYWDWQAVLEHDLSAHTRVRLAVFGGDDRFALVFNAPSAQDPIGGELSAGITYNRTQLRLESDLSEHASIVAMLSWAFTDASQRYGDAPFDFRIHGITARSELRYRVAPWLTASVGLDAHYAHSDVAANIAPYPTTNEVPSPYFARPRRRLDKSVFLVRPALYAQLETRVGPLTLLPSVRADYGTDTEDVTLDPRLGLRLRLVRGERPTTLKAGVGLYHQAPLPQESIRGVGTEGVRSNRAVHASLGIEQRLSDMFEVSAEGFYKRLTNLVVATADEGSPLGARFDNTGSGHVYGAEALLRILPGGPLSGWLAYTLSRSVRRERDGDPLYTFAWDQTHILSAVGNLALGWGMTLGARFRLITGTPYTPYTGAVIDLDAGAYAPVRSSEPFSARLPTYHQLDVRLDKQWEFEAWKLMLYLELRNAYNRENAEAITYNYDYSRNKPVSGLPLLPVLGIRGEL